MDVLSEHCPHINYPICLHGFFCDSEKRLGTFFTHLENSTANEECIKAAHTFLCADAYPVALPEGAILPPCRESCLRFKTSCEPYLDNEEIEEETKTINCSVFPTEEADDDEVTPGCLSQ